jgi:hypothetical protein
MFRERIEAVHEGVLRHLKGFVRMPVRPLEADLIRKRVGGVEGAGEYKGDDHDPRLHALWGKFKS